MYKRQRLTVSSSYDHLVRRLVLLSGLKTKSRLAPRCAWARTSDRSTALTTSMWMVIRVHNLSLIHIYAENNYPEKNYKLENLYVAECYACLLYTSRIYKTME